ncbi:Ost2 [Kluyveromyces lactis]|nr:Ost2 [Kluyveromyces lactis]
MVKKQGSGSNATVSKFVQFSESLGTAYSSYLKEVKGNKQLLLIDSFLAFLVVLGVVQFLFVLLIRDNFPFNAFLSGFIICVGQFVLLVSLRLQLISPFEGISKQRAFGEFIVASLVLHFISVHFVN